MITVSQFCWLKQKRYSFFVVILQIEPSSHKTKQYITALVSGLYNSFEKNNE